eukprot:CAMPEP_0182853104 /NCGR_PEP_ID=MMETSP0034_2-20130328/522_1 /TAXON_ID=156128 /ORGANISM="Nephroselmis pyriformis, Strain CCMP717" /LENGTH=479 /DNA_ID=CAMNT_0024983855 /DNA_START=319 /DNA_END=1754 /DNA_ORIENTATION=-
MSVGHAMGAQPVLCVQWAARVRGLKASAALGPVSRGAAHARGLGPGSASRAPRWAALGSAASPQKWEGRRVYCAVARKGAPAGPQGATAAGPEHLDDDGVSSSGDEQSPSYSRRELLAGSSSFVAAACSAAAPWEAGAITQVQRADGTVVSAYELPVPLKLVSLRGSIPATWPDEFKSTQGKSAKYFEANRQQISTIYSELREAVAGEGAGGGLASKVLQKAKTGAKGKGIAVGEADLVTLGDVWLAPAIREGLIKPIAGAEDSSWWADLPPRWRRLMRRNAATGEVDPQGEVYGCPYRWGSTLIAYRKDRPTGGPVADWEDLWRPELTGRVSFLDSPREVVGAALKATGRPYNARDWGPAECQGAVEARWASLQKQVLLYSTAQQLKALGAGDVWAAVGWSGDIIPFAQRSPNVEVVAPASGTSLWADVWVVPATAAGGDRRVGPSPLVGQWLDFGLQPSRAFPSQGIRSGASPLLLP